MAIEVSIPEVGESVVEVQIGEWLKAEGDAVQKDEPLAVIESEKTNFELPSPVGGTVARIYHRAGETVRVGTVVASLETAVPQKPDSPKQTEPSAPSETQAEPAPETAPPPPKASPRPKRRHSPATPPAVSAAPASSAPQTTPEPEPWPAEVKEEAPPPAQPPPRARTGREEERVPMSMLRRTVARRLVEAQHAVAALTTFAEIDMGAVQRLRQDYREPFQKRFGIRLGLTSFFVKAAIAALKEFPQLNAQVSGNDILYHNYFDIGVAIATPQGLVVPVLPNAERLSFAEIEHAVADFAHRARERQLKPDELEAGTFTITNGGVFGSLLSTPLINPPQAGILGLHAISERPVARNGAVVIRPMMYAALTYDHRIVDGREAVLFLRTVKEMVEAPARMLLEA